MLVGDTRYQGKGSGERRGIMGLHVQCMNTDIAAVTENKKWTAILFLLFPCILFSFWMSQQPLGGCLSSCRVRNKSLVKSSLIGLDGRSLPLLLRVLPLLCNSLNSAFLCAIRHGDKFLVLSFEDSVVGIIGRATTVDQRTQCLGPCCSPTDQEQMMPLAPWSFVHPNETSAIPNVGDWIALTWTRNRIGLV